MDYLRDPAAIYEKSFVTVRAEADLERFPDDLEEIAVRLIHACGVVEVAADIDFTSDAVAKGRAALAAGAPIYVDAKMVGAGIIARHVPNNDVICTLDAAGVAEVAKQRGTTRSAAAVDQWHELSDAVVVIGNAPTALFRLLERIAGGAAKPAVVLGFPVGFVGAAESKRALADSDLGLEYITLHGRMGGSAIASASFNALAAGLS